MNRFNFLAFCFLIALLNPIFAHQSIQTNPNTAFLIGTEEGLFKKTETGLVSVWNKASVQKIMYTDGWILLTSEGVIYSKDLLSFESRNEGLPFNTVKEYDGENTSFVKHVHPLKDLEYLIEDPRIMVTTTKDQVYITRDAGLSWTSLGFSARTNGAKSVGLAMLPMYLSDGTSIDMLTVFLSHAIYGLGYIRPDSTNPKWIDLLEGFELIPTTKLVNEIADILTVQNKSEDGTITNSIYLTQSFIPNMYKLNWKDKSASLISAKNESINTWDSLVSVGENLVFVSLDGIRNFSPTTSSYQETSYTDYKILSQVDKAQNVLSAWLPPTITQEKESFSLSELWMLDMSESKSPYNEIADHKRSLYVPSGKVISEEGIDSFLNIVKENDLNSIVIDMKDDVGVLRYESKDPLVKKLGYTSRYALDIENFITKCKEKNVYLIARLVVFKDKNLYNYNNQEYAVWDEKNNKAWLGINSYDENNVPSFYGEYWVDPYSHEVWEYNIAIAKELIALGFDEIQFDYIRFPTDGYNLYDAQFRWQDTGMDKESALLSFLSYARKNIKAPIGIDIYGVNGWYRSGARTGQEVELIAPYVDVICPMHYPSHYDQDFLDYQPIEERPYRVYLYGTHRNVTIARNKVIVRPWLQSFYLNVSYDRNYYNTDYVQRQVFGVRDASDSGYMYWNNVGRYDEVRPHIGSKYDNLPYPWIMAEMDKIDSISNGNL